MAPLAKAVGAAVVDEGVEVGAEAVVEVADDEVVVAVAVQVGDCAGPGAVGGYLYGLAAAQRVAIAEGRGLLAVVVVVGEDEVDVAVAVQVELVDALEDARAGDVEVVAGVAHGAAAEALETACDPSLRFTHIASVLAPGASGPPCARIVRVGLWAVNHGGAIAVAIASAAGPLIKKGGISAVGNIL